MNSRTIQYMSVALFGLLIVWGGFTFVAYIGTPYHAAALLGDNAGVSASCEPSATWCYFTNGLKILPSIIAYTVGRTSPLIVYVILFALGYAAFAGWQWLSAGRSTVRIAWKPWKILLLFILSVWLLITVLGFGSVDDRKTRVYIEPTAETYTVSEQSLEILRKDYLDLLGRGCLNPAGETQSGASVYTLEFWCMETAFITRVLTQILFVLLLLAEFLILGRLALRAFKVRFTSLALEALTSAATGGALMIVVLWSVAVAGIYEQWVGWIVAAAIPAIGFVDARYWLNVFLKHTWEREYRWYDVTPLLGWLLLSYFALNFLEVVRPFPIGWDDLGSYLNRPRLLVSYGHFIYSMSPFDWTYVTSLGFLLFGYSSSFGSTASMMVNWSAGLLATLSIFVFARTFLGPRSGWLSALLYYALPLVGHFSFADMKVDNAVFFFGTMGVLMTLLAIAPPANQTPSDAPATPNWKLLTLAGLFVGFAFATKSTAIMVVLPLLAILFGVLVHWSAFLGTVFLAFLIFSWQGVLSVEDVITRIGGTTVGTIGTIFTTACFVGMGLCFAFAVMKRRTPLLSLSRLVAAFILGLALAVVPWIMHNNIRHGTVVPRLELSAPNTISKGVGVENLPAELAVDRNDPTCKPSGAKEELDRYWGFDHSWAHYLTLPWRTVMNIDATGYYVTTIPALLLFPLLLLLPYFWSRDGKWLRWLTWGTGLMIAEWMFLANGIPWYGIGIFLGVLVGIEALFARAPDTPNKIAVGVLIGASLFVAFGFRFWQFDQQRNLFEYSIGKISAEAMQASTIPYYQIISDEAVRRHEGMADRPYLYRIGTFIPYFIPKNLEVIGINDHQLDVFNCLYQERDVALTVRRLKALGFNSMIFDTNTATIERDEQGSLHKKVDAFVQFVNNVNSGLQVVISDPNAGVAFILIP